MSSNPSTLSPFCIRLSADEREQLKLMAANLRVSQGAFIRSYVFDDIETIKRTLNAKTSTLDHEALSKLLLLLGESRIANNLNQLPMHANQGTLDLPSAEIEEQLNESYLAIQWMRKTLIKGMGLKL
ncbi:MAG: hypothetical protein MJK04_34870 [Psychrosphaera sp.]|nr:hypothetical protein [Psychrosphaera sp.]